MSIEVIPLNFSLKPDNYYGNARGLVSSRQCTLIKIMNDAGLIGYGEAFGSPKVVSELIHDIQPFFIGVEASQFPVIVSRLMNLHYHTASKGYMLCALSGIEMAGWDLFAKELNLPVYQLLGGQARKKFLPYASTGYITSDNGLDRLKEQVQQAEELQFKAIKIKIGTGLKDDIKRVEAVRKISSDMLLMVDINGNYTADIALQCIKELESYTIYWVEEPVPPHDYEGFRKIKESCHIPIASGEAEYTRYGFRDLIQHRLVDIVQPDLAKCGGIYEAKAISMMAQANNVRISPHIWGGLVGRAAAAHLMASIPYYPHSLEEPEPMLFEFDLGENALRDDLGQGPLILNDGWLELQDTGGFGLLLDEDKIEYYKMKEGMVK